MSPHEEPLKEEQFSQPLAGLLVADFSRVLAGPLTTMTLADLGARVIKVEHPDTGDDTRSWGPPYSATGATDAPIAVACGNNSQFGKLCAVLGLEHLAEDPRFSSNAVRVKYRGELEVLLEDALKASTANEWQTRLSEAGVPVGQVLDIAGGIDFAEKLGLEPTVSVVGDHGESVDQQFRHPLTWDPPLPRTASAPPALGQHSQEVLAWLRSLPNDEPANSSEEQS